MQSNQPVQQSCSRLLEGLAAHNQAAVSGKCPPSSNSITPRCSGREISLNTELLTHMTKAAPSQNQTTGRVFNPENAEVPDYGKDEGGAPVMMAVRKLHSQIKPQIFFQTADRRVKVFSPQT